MKNFFVLEGIDGTGKTTLAKRISKEFGLFYTKEPTESKIGHLIREKLLTEKDIDPKTMALLFTADRIDHLAELNKIKESVICDRFILSTLAYQKESNVIHKNIIKKFLSAPKLTLYIDIPPNIAIERISNRNSFDYYEEINILEQTRKNYLNLIKENPSNIIIIDGNKNIDEVYSNIISILESKYEKMWYV